jgi:hypothetical protein
MVAGAGHGFIDGVIDYFIKEVVQTALVGAADVHAGAPPYGLPAAEYLDIFCGIFRRFGFNFLFVI